MSLKQFYSFWPGLAEAISSLSKMLPEQIF
jgi:hypothetical protein